MNFEQSYDVVYIGNYTKDTIITPSGTQYVDGGAVNYAANAGARLGFKVAVLIHLSKEDQRVIDKLQQAGVNCLVKYTLHSTSIKLVYPTLNVDQRDIYITSIAEPIEVNEIASINACAFVIGTTLRGEVGLEVIQVLRQKKALLAGDVQGFVRVQHEQRLVYEPWDEMQDVLACLDILKMDAVEAEFLTGTHDIYQAVRYFADAGPAEVLLTHKDGLLVHVGDEDHDIGFYPTALNGRSGRGDTCLGAYAAMRLKMPPKEAGIWAAAVTSLKMESPTPFNRGIHEVEELIQNKYRDESLPRKKAN